MPDPDHLAAAVSDLFDILSGLLRDTKLEADLEDLLWGLTDLFHKKAARVQSLLDGNGDKQKRSAEEQDGSEVRSVELERLLAQGEELIERHKRHRGAQEPRRRTLRGRNRLRLAAARRKPC